MRPSFETASLIYDWANIVLIVALVFSAISTVLVVWMGNVKEGHLRRDLASASVDAAHAVERTAVAEQRTAEAELRLKQLEPRVLNWDAFVASLKGAPQCPVEVLYVADDWDSMALAQQIQLAVESAGWKQSSRNPIEKPLSWTDPTPMAVDGQPIGVTIVALLGTEPETIAAGSLLSPRPGPITPFSAMEQAVLVGLGKVGTWLNGPHAPPAGTLRIVVAPKG